MNNHMKRLEGKVAIITGANAGIGKATAALFAREGANLVLAARRLDKLKEVEEYAASLGAAVWWRPAWRPSAGWISW